MMAVALLVAHKLRDGWRGWAGLAVIAAGAGGAVVAAAAGASRTDSAYPRFLAQSRASDMLVSPAGDGTTGYDAALGALPGVAASAALVGINALPATATGVPDNGAVVFASLGGRYGRVLDVPKLLAGRLPPAAITPPPVLWMIPATLLIAALVALPPARSVARVPAAATLRSE